MPVTDTMKKKFMTPLQAALVAFAVNVSPGKLTQASEKKLSNAVENIKEDIEDAVTKDLQNIIQDFGPQQEHKSQSNMGAHPQNFTDTSQNGIMDDNQSIPQKPTPNTLPPEKPTSQFRPKSTPQEGEEVLPPKSENETPNFADQAPNTENTQPATKQNQPSEIHNTNNQAEQNSNNPETSADTGEMQQRQTLLAGQRRLLTGKQQRLQEDIKNARKTMIPLQARAAKLKKMIWALSIPQYVLIFVFIICALTVVLLFTGLPEAIAFKVIGLGAKKKRVQMLLDTVEAKLKPLKKLVAEKTAEGNKINTQKMQLTPR